jgi:hypothetical protein
LLEAGEPGSENAGTIFFTLRTTRLTIVPFSAAQQVAHGGDDHVLDLGLAPAPVPPWWRSSPAR